MRKIIRHLLPSLLLVGFLGLLWKGLASQHNIHQSSSENKPFPVFTLMDLHDKNPIITLKNLENRVHVVHVWATWCGICVKEHPVWMEIKQQWPQVSLVGIVYRDDDQRALQLIKEKGDPYRFLLHDAVGNLGLDLGIVGTPETYIIDAQGVIRYHHVGPMSKSLFEEKLLPIIQSLMQTHSAEVIKEYRCVTCPNQSIADSHAPVAQAMKTEITRRLATGESPESIRHYLISRYGEYVVYRPSNNRHNAVLWWGPASMLVLGAGTWYFRSHKKPSSV